ncbi:hypothetical protein BJX70DRAFT_35816 [Aspergillus crustosus]
MFAAVSPMQQFPTSSHYPWTPARSSPLSPRRTSASSPTTAITATPIQQPIFSQSPSSIFTFSPSTSPLPSFNESATNGISSQTRTSIPSHNANATSPTYATRYKTTICNPLIAHSTKRTNKASTSPAARSVRRNAFLNRVKQNRETGRIEARAEQLAFLENAAEQKEWVEGMRIRAEEIQVRFGLGIEEEEYLDNATEAEIQALDEYLEQEHALEMELLEGVETGPDPLTEHEQAYGNLQPGKLKDTTSSFSDDEYEDIFMDLVDYSSAQDGDMDMSG